MDDFEASKPRADLASFQVTTSFAGAAGGLLQIVPLILYYVKLFILGSTPRSVFGIKYNMNGVAWGTLVSADEAKCDSAPTDLFLDSQWPNMTLLTVIGLSYSIIAPLICGFAFVAFFLYWFVYKVSRPLVSLRLKLLANLDSTYSTCSSSSSTLLLRQRLEDSSTRRP